MVMFSINPGYDFNKGDYANGTNNERMDLYRRCEKEGVGISVMKPFSGGQLLEDRTSPCMPCPAGLDIGLINKYYDLARLGDNLAKDHYMNLEKTAKDCITCGHCNMRCPFKVNQVDRMKEIKEYFGK